MLRLAVLLASIAAPAAADTLVAARTVRPQAILTAADVSVVAGDRSGVFSHPADVIGMEARVALYPGRPIGPEDIGPPAIVDRNAIVTLVFRQGGLTIVAEARALGRGGAGDRLRVMNLSSKSIVTGTVQPDGSLRVGGPDLPARY